MRRTILTFVLAVLTMVLAACGAVATPSPTVTSAPADTDTPEPTQTPKPTETPTRTPRPTETPTPTALPLDFPGLIAYVYIEGAAEIYTMRADGSDDTAISDGEGQVLSLFPSWSPDGSLIAYMVVDPNADTINIAVIDTETGESRQITQNGVRVGATPVLVWSADKRYLAYTQFVEGDEPDIMRVDVSTGQIINLTQGFKWDAFPSWSPDGTQIAFESDREGLDAIWVMNMDGTNPRNLTADAPEWENILPSWSPDGSMIAFYRWSVLASGDGGPGGLWVMNADGSDAHVVAEFQGLRGSEPPAWSPDGSLIAYIDPGTVENSEVWVVPVEGGDPVQVSHQGGVERNLSWSPDSRALLFTQDFNGELHLWLATADGTFEEEIADGGRNGLGDWSPE